MVRGTLLTLGDGKELLFFLSLSFPENDQRITETVEALIGQDWLPSLGSDSHGPD